MSLDDRDLVTLLAIDLNSYFLLLVQTYQQELYAFAVRMARNHQDAEDIVQDTFIRAHAALAKFSTAEIQHLKIRPWLFKITYHLTLNHIKRHGKLHSLHTSIDRLENREALENTDRGR